MLIIVTETNVFIDLLEVDALSEFFALPFEICTTDFVMREILDKAHKDLLDAFVRAKKLTIHQSSWEEIFAMNTMQILPSLKRIADRSALWKAKELRAMLLTEDRTLRKAAESHGLEVHGILWVIDQMTYHSIIMDDDGRDIKQKFHSINSWLLKHDNT